MLQWVKPAMMLFWLFAHSPIIHATFSPHNQRHNSWSLEKKNTFVILPQAPSKNPGTSHDATEQKYLFT